MGGGRGLDKESLSYLFLWFCFSQKAEFEGELKGVLIRYGIVRGIRELSTSTGCVALQDSLCLSY